jgi:hypothetical protein
MQRWWSVGLVLWLSAGCQRPVATGEAPRDVAQAAVPAAGAGSVAGACLGEGEGSSAYDEHRATERGEPAPACCAGLTRLEAYEPAMQPGQCLASKGGRFTCARCGDGQCRVGESHCNCATDCP